MKTAHNAEHGSNSTEQMLSLHHASEGTVIKVNKDMAASPPPSLSYESLRQVYKAPVRHRGAAAD